MVDEVGYDAIIVGGGFAGLTAALWLGRFRRRTLVLSSGPSRNASACAAHGYPGYDGADPAELLAKLTQEVDQYPSVTRKDGHVGTAVKEGDTFCVRVGERVYTSRRILVATGIEDVAPDLPEFDSFAGTSIWHCPACDGYEYTGKRLAIMGRGPQLAGYLAEFLPYTEHLTVLTNGAEPQFSDAEAAALHRRGIPVHTEAVRRLVGHEGQLEWIELDDGTHLDADAIFYSVGHIPQTELIEQLGCEQGPDGVVMNRCQETTVAGVYAAGDIAPLEEIIVVAAAMGAVAANNLHHSLAPTL